MAEEYPKNKKNRVSSRIPATKNRLVSSSFLSCWSTERRIAVAARTCHWSLARGCSLTINEGRGCGSFDQWILQRPLRRDRSPQTVSVNFSPPAILLRVYRQVSTTTIDRGSVFLQRGRSASRVACSNDLWRQFAVVIRGFWREDGTGVRLMILGGWNEG